MEGWLETTLSYVANVQSGAGFPKKYQGKIGLELPFYKVSDMNIPGNEREMVYVNNTISVETQKELGASVFPADSILFPKIGGAITTNKKRLTTRPCCVDNNVMGLIPKTDQVRTDYLFYFMLGHDLVEFSNKAHLPSIRKTTVENWPFLLPPLPEQQRIVAILEEAFEGIDAAIANTQQNLANARELFESYLGEVLTDTVTITHTQTLADITELIIDCEHKTAPTQETGFPSIRTPNIGKGHLLLDNVNHVSEETYVAWTRRGEPKPGDLILAREAPAGNVGVIPPGQKVCLGQRTVLIRPDSKITIPQFLAYYLLHPITQNRLLAHSTGATVQHVNMRDIRGLPIGQLPSIDHQEQLLGFLEYGFEAGGRLEAIYQQKLDALSELKQSILQKAFSGELSREQAAA